MKREFKGIKTALENRTKWQSNTSEMSYFYDKDLDKVHGVPHLKEARETYVKFNKDLLYLGTFPCVKINDHKVTREMLVKKINEML